MKNLEKYLLESATKLIVEHEKYAKWVNDENARRRRRSISSVVPVPLLTPGAWSGSTGFNPYLVRSRRQAIAHAVNAALHSRTYLPRPAVTRDIPKVGGGHRAVSQFEIADEVVSKQVFLSLLRKNGPKLSGHSYAYRPGYYPHDALSHIHGEFRRANRLYIAEYDFSRYFDSIHHDAIWASLDRMGIYRTVEENHVIDAFLRSSNRATLKGVSAGLPQGTSLSLFLANVVASDLDRGLERAGVGFARYADDTIVWSGDYRRVSDAVEVLHEESRALGVSINHEKSSGVRILVPKGTRCAEMPSTEFVEYLGHRVSLDKISIRANAVHRIKSRIERLIYNNLLREPLAGTQDVSRLAGIDRDYVVLIWQLRRYLYGPLSESEVWRFQNVEVPPLGFEGVMSFFPLVNDERQLKELDIWLASRVWLALRKRRRLLGMALSDPHGLPIDSLIGYRGKSTKSGASIDLRVPSFVRVASVIRRAISTHGHRAVGGGAGPYSY